jgi:hypothetical protein
MAVGANQKFNITETIPAGLEYPIPRDIHGFEALQVLQI